jgi:hypothetical protein
MSVEHWWKDNWLRKTEVLTVGQEPVLVPSFSIKSRSQVTPGVNKGLT